MRHFIVSGGAKADVVVGAVLASLSSMELYLSHANNVLAFFGLVVGLAVGLLRLRKLWLNRHEKNME